MGKPGGAVAGRAVAGRAVAVGIAACAAIMVSACGSSGSTAGSASSSATAAATEPTSTALVTAMQAAVRQADSVHISGQLTNNGTPIGVNLDMHRNGDVSGTVSQNGAPFQVIGVDGTIYIKATRSFLQAVKAPTSACPVVCGKWLLLTPAEARQLTGDLSMTSLTGPLTSGQVPKLAEAGSKTVNGQAAWVLRASDGSTLDVSSASQHYPLAAATGGSPSEVVMYSRWNSAPQPVAPPAGEVLNLNNLK